MICFRIRIVDKRIQLPNLEGSGVPTIFEANGKTFSLGWHC